MALTPEHSPGATPPIDTLPTNTPDKFSYKSATFEEVLEDLSSRFILNLPEDELAEIERVCFQVEQAHWYYEDFIRDANPSFPSLPLKKFSEILFRSCPLLHHWSHDHETAFNDFMSYKTRVPVCGAIMLNEALTKCVLVKGWKSSAGWGFPKGKVNENEDPASCAAREVLEETGYNLGDKIRGTECIRLSIKQQPIALFVVPGVPEDFSFKTQTRKEISKIDWFNLADLPTWKKNRSSTNKFYLIMPVVGPLKAIVRQLRKVRRTGKTQHQMVQVPHPISPPEVEDDPGVDDPATVVTVSLRDMEHEPLSQSQSGEAEISSSQSSSIDPHTPSVNGDLAPLTSEDCLVSKHNFSRDSDEILVKADMGLSSAIFSPGSNADPRIHWSRLMTRLNHSEESSPIGTPQSSTPTPPVLARPKPSDSRPLGDSQIYQTGVTPGNTQARPTNAPTSNRSSGRQPSISQSSPSFSSPPGPGSSNFSISFPNSSAALDPTPEVIVKLTRQLQLLDSVVAEDTARRTPQPGPPMSAHILGAFPRSNGLVPDQISATLRSASVNPEAPRNASIPFHHHQHKLSVPSFSDVLPSSAATLRHPFIRASNDFAHHTPPTSSHGSAPILPASRPATTLPSQLHLISRPRRVSNSSALPLVPTHSSPATVDPAHRGQMLSILSGSASVARPSPLGKPSSSNRSFSSTSTIIDAPMTPAPRSNNAHLLSILNNPLQGRSSPAIQR